MAAAKKPTTLGVVGKYAGSAASNTAAFAGGAAIAPVLAPILQTLKNETWSKDPTIPPDVGAMAEGVAQGQVDPAQAAKWAAEHGIGAKAFAALVNVATVGPGVSAGLELWRRGITDETGFRRAAKRAGLEAEWIDDLAKTKRRLLDAADLARGIHRGLIPDPGLLKGEKPGAGGKVPAYPVYPIDALAEA